jgi:hypothetical protein
MPVLGFYKVRFAHEADSHAELVIALAVGDGEHPVVARAQERLTTLGIDTGQWKLVEVVELLELPR